MQYTRYIPNLKKTNHSYIDLSSIIAKAEQYLRNSCNADVKTSDKSITNNQDLIHRTHI